MALNKICPKCGNAVSDKATYCPNCQFKLVEEDSGKVSVCLCEDCGTELSAEDTVCPTCGCPVVKRNADTKEDLTQKVEITSVNLTKPKIFQKKYIVIISFVLVLLIVIGMVVKKNNETKVSNDYSKNLKSASTLMLLGASEAESAGNLIKSVWYNTIYEKNDSKTNKYTKSRYGFSFNDDFNDSLSALFEDSDFISQIESIQSNKDSVAALMKTLNNPPEEYKAAYDAIKDYYDAYLELTSLAISPSGSLTTYSNNFNEADSKTVKCYEAMNMYIE